MFGLHREVGIEETFKSSPFFSGWWLSPLSPLKNDWVSWDDVSIPNWWHSQLDGNININISPHHQAFFWKYDPLRCFFVSSLVDISSDSVPMPGDSQNCGPLVVDGLKPTQHLDARQVRPSSHVWRNGIQRIVYQICLGKSVHNFLGNIDTPFLAPCWPLDKVLYVVLCCISILGG